MADAPPALPLLQLIEGETDGYCDAETGVCAVPAAAAPAEPVSETPPPDPRELPR